MCSEITSNDIKNAVIRETIRKVNEYIKDKNNSIECINIALLTPNSSGSCKSHELNKKPMLNMPGDNIKGLRIPSYKKVQVLNKDAEYIIYEIIGREYVSDDLNEKIMMDINEQKNNNMGYLHLFKKFIPIEPQSVIIVSNDNYHITKKNDIEHIDVYLQTNEHHNIKYQNAIYADESIELYNLDPTENIIVKDIVNKEQKYYIL